MIKTLINQNYGIVNYMQVGIEKDNKFSGIYIYRNTIGYIHDNEKVNQKDIAKYLEEHAKFKELIDETKETLKTLGIAFSKERNKFVLVNKEAYLKYVRFEFENNYEKDLLIGNKEIEKEKKVKLIKEDVIFLLNEMTSVLQILKANDEKEYEEFSKSLNISIDFKE